jgi:hypothetical protein
MARSPSVRAGEDVVRRCLALALGDDPMFDADSLTGKPVRPARDVAGSEDALDAVLEVLIDDSAAIDLESRLFRHRNCRPAGRPPIRSGPLSSRFLRSFESP